MYMYRMYTIDLHVKSQYQDFIQVFITALGFYLQSVIRRPTQMELLWITYSSVLQYSNYCKNDQSLYMHLVLHNIHV